MTSEKRSGASSKELDKYGVWVKSDPSMLSEENGELPVVPLMKNTDVINDDLENFEDTTKQQKKDLNADSEAAKTHDPPFESSIPDTSIQLLVKIVEELSSIKEELSSFKEGVLSLISGVNSQTAQKESENIIIAGDELEDILNSADFIEDIDVPITADGIDDISEEDLAFLKEDTFANETVFEGNDPPAVLPMPVGQDSVLEDAEKLQWLIQEGDKPFTEKTAGETENNTLLIDDLLIESGSIKDMPIDMDIEEDEFFEEDEFLEEEDYSLDDDDAVLSALPSFDQEPLNKIIFPDEYIDISDEELDKIEQNVLREFSNKLPIIEEIFFLGENKTNNLNKGGGIKKT